MEKVTIEKLKEKGSVSNAIEWAKKQYPTIQERPKKPFLKNAHTSADVKQYSQDLEKYEVDKNTYDVALASYRLKEKEINQVIVEYIKKMAGLDQIPERSREKVWTLAYEKGHSNGYYEVYLELDSLIELF